MFEPLQKLFDKHATSMTGVLKEMRAHLAMMVENTLTKMQFDQFGAYTANGVKLIELQNNEGFYWRVFCTGITNSEEKNIGVYVGTASANALVAVIKPVKLAAAEFAEVSNQKFIVPPRSTIFFKTEGGNITAALQVERLLESPEYETRKSMSYDVSDIDKHLQEPDRHRPERTVKPSPEELRGTSVHS